MRIIRRLIGGTLYLLVALVLLVFSITIVLNKPWEGWRTSETSAPSLSLPPLPSSHLPESRSETLLESNYREQTHPAWGLWYFNGTLMPWIPDSLHETPEACLARRETIIAEKAAQLANQFRADGEITMTDIGWNTHARGGGKRLTYRTFFLCAHVPTDT